jgi:hypothetical protein
VWGCWTRTFSEAIEESVGASKIRSFPNIFFLEGLQILLELI